MNPATLNKAHRAVRCQYCDCKIPPESKRVSDRYGDIYCDRKCRDDQASLQARMYETPWDIGDRD